MYAGRVVEDLTLEQLLTGPLHPYTRALLGAVPGVGLARPVRLADIPGQPPDLSSPPAGCAYHPRCPLAIGRCHHERPPLLQRPSGQRVACWVANQDMIAPERARN